MAMDTELAASSGPATVQGAAQVADPCVGVFPGGEVAAVVVGVDVDVVEQSACGLVVNARTRSSGGLDAGWLLVVRPTGACAVPRSGAGVRGDNPC